MPSSVVCCLSFTEWEHQRKRRPSILLWRPIPTKLPNRACIESKWTLFESKKAFVRFVPRILWIASTWQPPPLLEKAAAVEFPRKLFHRPPIVTSIVPVPRAIGRSENRGGEERSQLAGTQGKQQLSVLTFLQLMYHATESVILPLILLIME